MKKTFILLSLLLLTFSTNAFAQKVLTAKQLFMALPNDYVVGTAKARAAYLAFPKSIKPDFLSFMITDQAVPKMIAGDFKEPQSIGDMRVFRGKTSTIVGLRYQIGDGKEQNPTTDTTKILTYLLEYKAGKWTNVTDSLLPKISVDDAFQVLSQGMKDLKKEDVWIETQVSKDRNGLLSLARVKGDDSITPLKFFKWNGAKFVETEE
jgi:hypothetical protein